MNDYVLRFFGKPNKGEVILLGSRDG